LSELHAFCSRTEEKWLIEFDFVRSRGDSVAKRR
jgi:hypothetical protein